MASQSNSQPTAKRTPMAQAAEARLVPDPPRQRMNVNANANVEPKLLRIRDVVTRVALSKSAIAKLEAEGLFPARLKLGRAARWRTSDIDAWLAAL